MDKETALLDILFENLKKKNIATKIAFNKNRKKEIIGMTISNLGVYEINMIKASKSVELRRKTSGFFISGSGEEGDNNNYIEVCDYENFDKWFDEISKENHNHLYLKKIIGIILTEVEVDIDTELRGKMIEDISDES